MFFVFCCTLSSTSRWHPLFHPANLWPALISHVNITESREPYYLLTRMSTVSNSLLAFLRDTFGIELKNCIRNLLILIFRETKRAPRRPPSIPRRMVGMKAKTLMSSKFLTWVKERRKQQKFWASCQWHQILHPLLKTWCHQVISIQEINLSLQFKEFS